MSREPVSELSDEELKDLYETYYSQIENELGISTSDLRYFYTLQKEVQERGGEIWVSAEVRMPEEATEGGGR